MATINSFADVTSQWQKLLAACADNAPLLTNAEPQRLALETILKELLDLKALQDSYRGAKQEARQKLEKVLQEGREAARRLQSGVKANIGTNNERLVQFRHEAQPAARTPQEQGQAGPCPGRREGMRPRGALRNPTAP